MSIWERWAQGQPVTVKSGVFAQHIGVLQDASGEGEGRIDHGAVLKLAFLVGGRVEHVWVREADCEPFIGQISA